MTDRLEYSDRRWAVLYALRGFADPEYAWFVWGSGHGFPGPNEECEIIDDVRRLDFEDSLKGAALSIAEWRFVEAFQSVLLPLRIDYFPDLRKAMSDARWLNVITTAGIAIATIEKGGVGPDDRLQDDEQLPQIAVERYLALMKEVNSHS